MENHCEAYQKLVAKWSPFLEKEYQTSERSPNPQPQPQPSTNTQDVSLPKLEPACRDHEHSEAYKALYAKWSPYFDDDYHRKPKGSPSNGQQKPNN